MLKRFAVVFGVLSTLIQFMMYGSPHYDVETLAAWVRSYGWTPPWWLQDSNADFLARFLTKSIFALCMAYLLWGFARDLIGWYQNRPLRTLQQIIRKLPAECVPKDGKWSLPNHAQTTAFESKIVGRQAQLSLIVGGSEATRDGRYIGTSHIFARLPLQQTEGLPVLLLAYFDRADMETVRSVMLHRSGDRVEVRGRIIRAEISDRQDKGGACLNIDLATCGLVTH